MYFAPRSFLVITHGAKETVGMYILKSPTMEAPISLHIEAAIGPTNVRTAKGPSRNTASNEHTKW